MRASWLRTRSGTARIGCLGAAALLAGCVEQFPNTTGGPGDFQAVVGHADAPSPRTAPMAFASIDGAPDRVVARFKTAVSAEAANRQITLAEPALARYLVRGYLDAYPTDNGTAIRYVWDVYDSAKHRTRRLDNGVDIPGAAPDPWSVFDDNVLSGLASRSADEIAAYLATTPEAGGSSASAPTGVGSAAPPAQPD